jgi:hypothetical protein
MAHTWANAFECCFHPLPLSRGGGTRQTGVLATIAEEWPGAIAAPMGQSLPDQVHHATVEATMPASFRSHPREHRLDAACVLIRPPRTTALLLLGGLGLALGMSSPGSAGEPGLSLANPTIASGGSVVACADFALTYTIGEAAVGTVSAGEWRMVTGFPATIPDPPPLQDNIFEDGFETPVPTVAAVKGACAP